MLSDVRSKMKTFIAGLALGLVVGSFGGFIGWHLYQRMEISTPLVNPEARLAALEAISHSDSIILEEAEDYGSDGTPSKVIHLSEASLATKSELELLFSQDTVVELPRWQGERRTVTACFIPHHRLRCTDPTGRITDIFVCFMCSNFSVNQQDKYHQMTASYKQQLKDIFRRQGFEIDQPRSEQDEALNP